MNLYAEIYKVGVGLYLVAWIFGVCLVFWLRFGKKEVEVNEDGVQ